MAKESISQELSQGEGAAGEASWRGRPAVEYYDFDEEHYLWWYAATNPTREGFSYSDTLVYLLEAERDTFRSEKYEVDTEVANLQGEVKKLLGMVGQLQTEAEELRVDRVRVGERLKKLSREAQFAKKEMKDKVEQVNLGMKCMRDAYNAFERVVTSAEIPVASGTDPSVNGAQRALVVFEEGEGSNVALGKSA